ncbi:IclR family transcriptional regulator domain-containing protein [Geodermatophilus sp. CPCC 206100]|uniref:IclR family transcriptional regulator domain-containing protein n=1 Tax=Geodermatophilus sp. CPCC 206100 TaxID=3020054 RepID=UPI003B00A10C
MERPSRTAAGRDGVPGGRPRPAEGMGGLAKGLAIIEAFGPNRRELSISEAAQLTGTSPASARRCLLTLQALGYLSFDGKFFRPTPRMVRLGASYLETAPLALLARPILIAAREELGESISLAVLESDESVFVARADAERIVSAGVRLGARLPAHASATGRVLLAGLSDDEVDAVLARTDPVRTTPHTLTTVEEIRQRVRRARDEGVAYTDEELELGIRTMAVPVRDSSGRVQAAMSAAAFASRVTLDDMAAEFLPVLREHAARLGRML